MPQRTPYRAFVHRAAERLGGRLRGLEDKAKGALLLEEARKEVKPTGALISSINAYIARKRIPWPSSNGRRPHQGLRECARRRGDWAGVSMIDAFKRYPYGINHRFPSINRPDRVEYDPGPAHEPSRIIVPGR